MDDLHPSHVSGLRYDQCPHCMIGTLVGLARGASRQNNGHANVRFEKGICIRAPGRASDAVQALVAPLPREIPGALDEKKFSPRGTHLGESGPDRPASRVRCQSRRSSHCKTSNFCPGFPMLPFPTLPTLPSEPEFQSSLPPTSAGVMMNE